MNNSIQAHLGGQTVRMFILGVVVLLMLVPLTFVEGVVQERQGFFNGVFADIANSWGAEQILGGPFLVIPETFTYTAYNKAGEEVQRQGYRKRVYLPKELELKNNISHQYRHRALYDVPVYMVDSQISGGFEVPPAADEDISLHLDEAFLVLGVSQTRAIKHMSALKFAGKSVDFASSTGVSWLRTGVHAALPGLAAGEFMPFEFTLRAQGSGRYAFVPLADDSRVAIRSTWPHPKFTGEYLPSAYEITDEGFFAQWEVHKLARPMPSQWLESAEQLDLSAMAASVDLFQPVTTYTIVDRGIKYGILFIGLTFLAVLCIELTYLFRFHYIQYAVIGAALVLFYQALLSLSEHLAFGWAYCIATLLLTLMISWYVAAMTRRRRLGGWVMAVLLILYACLYILLQLQAYALLAGTTLLVVALFAVMFATRRLTLVEGSH